MIHQPGLVRSNKPFFPQSTFKGKRISSKKIITYEQIKGIKKPWISKDGTITADNGFLWVRHWEKDENYCLEEIFNLENELVALYIDICSPIKEHDKTFEYLDWYLDIFVDLLANKSPIIMDEDELKEALKAGFISSENSDSARKTVNMLIKKLMSKNYNFIYSGV
jgi:predicted RNA-binding protein associated with RNAse of E/G family